MKYLILVSIWLGPLSLAEMKFTGLFTHPSFSAPPCDKVFFQTKYNATYYRVGPTKRTAVLHFSSDAPGAFFSGVVLVGLYGPSSDIVVEKTFERNGIQYQVQAEGIVDYHFLVLELKVRAQKGNVIVCRAKSDFGSVD